MAGGQAAEPAEEGGGGGSAGATRVACAPALAPPLCSISPAVACVVMPAAHRRWFVARSAGQVVEAGERGKERARLRELSLDDLRAEADVAGLSRSKLSKPELRAALAAATVPQKPCMGSRAALAKCTAKEVALAPAKNAVKLVVEKSGKVAYVFIHADTHSCESTHGPAIIPFAPEGGMRSFLLSDCSMMQFGKSQQKPRCLSSKRVHALKAAVQA